MFFPEIESIKQKTEALTNELHKIASQIYQKDTSAPSDAQNEDSTSQEQKENVVDADYEVKNDNE